MNRKTSLLAVLLCFSISACNSILAGADGAKSFNIHDIQSCSHTSPYKNSFARDISGIITTKVNNGFYMQTYLADDMDCSSEAVFVFTKQYPDQIPGDRVLVSGRVEEFVPGQLEDHNLTLTEIVADKITLVSSGNELPSPVILGTEYRLPPPNIIDDDRMQVFDPETDGLDFFESLESMVIEIPGGVVVGPRNKYGEITIVLKEQLSVNRLTSEGALLLTEKDANPERILIKSDQFIPREVNIGDTIKRPVIGILDYSYGNFKIIPFNQVQVVPKEPGFQKFLDSEGKLTITSYNVENLSRFDSDKKFNTLAKQIVKNLSSPNFIVLHEVLDDSGIEDNGVVTAQKTIEKIINAIRKADGPEYFAVDIPPFNDQDGGITGGNIRSIILYRADKGINLIEDGLPASITQNPERIGTNSPVFYGTRKPLVSVFQVDGRQVIIIAVHLTSRGADSPLFGDAQPIIMSEDAKRIKQAEYLIEAVNQIKEQNQEGIIVLAGDMNDYPWSKVIRTISSLTEKIEISSDLNNQYSYVLDGNAFLFDYIFTYDPLSDGKANFQVIHLNTLFDSKSRISDHDPVIVSINLE